MAGYEDGKTKVGNLRNSELKTSSYIFGGYAFVNNNGLDLVGGASYTLNNYDAKRSINLGNIQDKAKADYKGSKLQLFAEGSKTVQTNANLALVPYVNAAHHMLSTDKITEKGSNAALEVKKQSNNVSQVTAGSKVVYEIKGAMPIALTANLGYQMSFGDVDTQTTNTFKGTNASFKTQGAKIDKNKLVFGAGAEAQLGKQAKLVASYDDQDKTLSLGFGVNF